MNSVLSLALLVGVSGALMEVPSALAQGYPTRPIRYVIPYPPGGTSDVIGRLVAGKLAEAIGQQVVVDNRPGANGIIALEIVARSTPDGYTVLMANAGPNAINPSIYKKLPYDAIKDFDPVTLLAYFPQLLVVNPSLGVTSVKDLVALAKSKPGQLNFASAGVGAANHLSGELFNNLAGIKMVHVPYKGDAAAFADIVAGQVAVMFPSAPSAMPFVRSGKLRALAVTSDKRIGSLPELPTIAEAGVPQFEAASWSGIMVRAGTPKAIVARLHSEFAKILKLPDVRDRLAGLGAETVGSGPAEFRTYLAAEIEKWKKVATEARVSLD